MNSSHPPLVRTRLSLMMFLEFFVWGGWMFALPAYVGKVLHFTGPEIGMLMSTTAIGGIIAPLFVGYIADRLFATERVLAVLHLLAGVCMFWAARQHAYHPMLVLLLLNGLFFMPTLALANSLVFRHLPDPSKFPRIAVLGTIGWIVATLAVAVILGGLETNGFFYLSGGGGIFMAAYCLTLPHTPPKGRSASGGDVFGLGALRLLREPSFRMFAVCAFLATIPAWVFFVCTTPMLQERGFPAPLALMTLNQVSEIVVMFLMPLFVAWLGLKRVLVIGMGTWVLRYLCFAAGGFPLVITGLLLHGFSYSFLFVGAYMFVDRRAPADMKASAQSLIAFLMLGVGCFMGCNLGGSLMERFQPRLQITSIQQLPPWNDPAAANSVWQYLDLSTLLTGKALTIEPGLGQIANQAGVITLAELQKVPADGLKLGVFIYSRDELINMLKKIKPTSSESKLQVSRAEWLAAQSHDWGQFWLWPAGASLAVCLLFALAYRDRS